MLRAFVRAHRVSLCLAFGLPLLFGLYTAGLAHNPPGFFIDESAISYNAYLIAQTGAGESGERWPLMFQHFTGHHVQYVSATHTYLLAIVFSIFRPSILLARLVAAAAVFSAALLLGALGRRISGKTAVGAIVAFIALATPWLFEASRLVVETFPFPLFLVLFLLSVYTAHARRAWRLLDSCKIAVSLSFLSYTYSSGRLIAPLLCLGLLLFVTNRRRFVGVITTMALYAVSLVPLFLFNHHHSGALTNRFYQVSYLKPSSPFGEILITFLHRCLEDLDPWRWLVVGDANPRHHVPGSLGSFLIGAMVLSLLGTVMVLIRHRRDRWWLFVLFGLAVSMLPGIITVDPFHTLRLVAVPVFLCVLAIPGILWLWEDRGKQNGETVRTKPDYLPRRRIALAVILSLTVIQAVYFQWVFHRDGPERAGYFDAAYKEVFDAAMASGRRPIYLVDASGPAYIHALWYATVEGKSTAHFIHLENQTLPPSGAMVIGSGQPCSSCTVILAREPFVLYTVP
ncbi:MAG: glycosyltransferase family 39 protein [Pyrinomonadaceae bacterium]